jgi:hypothetical protein
MSRNTTKVYLTCLSKLNLIEVVYAGFKFGPIFTTAPAAFKLIQTSKVVKND